MLGVTRVICAGHRAVETAPGQKKTPPGEAGGEFRPRPKRLSRPPLGGHVKRNTKTTSNAFKYTSQSNRFWIKAPNYRHNRPMAPGFHTPLYLYRPALLTPSLLRKSRRSRAYPQQIVTTRLLYCLQDPFAHQSRLQGIRTRSW